MRQIRVFAIMVIFCLILAGCGQNQTTEATEVKEVKAPAQVRWERPDWIRDDTYWLNDSRTAPYFSDTGKFNYQEFLDDLGATNVKSGMGMREDEEGKPYTWWIAFEYRGWSYALVTTIDGYGMTVSDLMISEPQLEACYKPQSELEWYLERHPGFTGAEDGYVKDYFYYDKPLASTGDLVLPYKLEYLNDFLLAILSEPTGVTCPFDGIIPHANVNTGVWYTKNHQPPSKPKTVPEVPGRLFVCFRGFRRRLRSDQLLPQWQSA